MAAREDVYCTLVLNDAYLPGASVLAHSLQDCGTTHKLACLVTPDTLSADALDELRTLFNYVISVPRIGNPAPSNLYLMDRPDLLYAFTKIHLWRQTQFRKIIYLDADVVALRAPEELFALEDNFAAAPDVGWPDAFNTGVMVLATDDGVYRALNNMATTGNSFDGADQGLLNQYFENKPWKRLSFTYNCTPSASYQYEPAYRFYKSRISLVHFIGRQKPWTQPRSSTGSTGVYQELVSQWWAVYDRHNLLAHHPHQDDVVRQNEPASATGYPPDAAMAETSTQHSLPKVDAPLSETPGHVTGQSQSSTSAHGFEAPQSGWDGSRAPPPIQSRPEAANFPSQIYEFNADPHPFQPPARYPDPPRNMWFEVPQKSKQPAERLPAIFPWEEREVTRPTRRFVEDEVDIDAGQSSAEQRPGVNTMDVSEFEVEADEQAAARTPLIKVTDAASWETSGPVSKNAWDEVSGIDSYVRALTSWQKTRGQVQVLQNNEASAAGESTIEEALKTADLSNLAETVRERRESLILTDFPSAIERPSLPVTPAPRRRTTFWGDERDDEGNLPSAEGVPDQVDWDPAEQLEQLRRNSLLGPEQLNLPAAKRIPDRAAIFSATAAQEAGFDQGIAPSVAIEPQL